MESSAQPGTILQADRRGMLIACGRNALQIHELQPEGKKRMTAESFCCGNPIAPGTIFDQDLAK